MDRQQPVSPNDATANRPAVPAHAAPEIAQPFNRRAFAALICVGSGGIPLLAIVFLGLSEQSALWLAPLVGLSISAYQTNNGGQRPKSLTQLSAAGSVTADCLLCPSRGRNAIEQCSYVLVDANSGDAYYVVAYELAKNHDGDGMSILYSDGHVEWASRKLAEDIIAQLNAGHNPPWDPATRPAAKRP